MKALLLVCVGLNIAITCVGVMLNSLELTGLGFASGTLCYIGYKSRKKNERQETI